MTGTASILPRSIVALTALLLAAGLFAWMNETGDGVARVADTLREQSRTINSSGNGSLEISAGSSDASEQVENPFWLECDWGLGGSPFGDLEMVLMLGAGGLGGLLAAIVVAPASVDLRRRWARGRRIPRAAWEWLRLTPNWMVGLIVAAALTAGLVAGATLASRTFGSDASDRFEQSVDAAVLNARDIYLRTGTTPYHISVPLPPGHTYSRVGYNRSDTTIRYCGPVAFGFSCVTRDIRNAGEEDFENPLGLRMFGTQRPVFMPELLGQVLWTGVFAGLFALAHGVFRAVRRPKCRQPYRHTDSIYS